MRLYDTLLAQTNICNRNWLEICSMINQLNDEQLEILYSLIIHHYIQEQLKKGHNIDDIKQQLMKDESKGKRKIIFHPYKGKGFDSGKGCTYVTKNLPDQLQIVIARYVDTITL